MNNKHFVIYGAEPYRHSDYGLVRSTIYALKHAMAFARDRKGFLLGDVDTLDYRNYQTPRSANRGDLSIAQSTNLFIENFNCNAEFDFIRWGDVEKLKKDSLSNFIISGGGYIFLDKNNHLPHRLTNDIEFFKKNGVRPILFGIGINYPSASSIGCTDTTTGDSFPETTRIKLRELLSLARAISVRDKYTQTTLSHYSDKPVHLIGDPALHYGHLNSITHEKIVAGNKVRPLIGINLNFHGPSSTLLLKRNLPIFADTLQSIQREHQCDFRYFVHFDSERIIPKLLALKNIRTETIDGEPGTLVRGYAGLDLHIGGMLHSCILAHSVDTPAIALAYDIKHSGFMDLFGLTDSCLPSPELPVQALIERVRELLTNHEHYTEIISITRNKLLQVTNDFVKRSLTVDSPP